MRDYVFPSLFFGFLFLSAPSVFLLSVSCSSSAVWRFYPRLERFSVPISFMRNVRLLLIDITWAPVQTAVHERSYKILQMSRCVWWETIVFFIWKGVTASLRIKLKWPGPDSDVWVTHFWVARGKNPHINTSSPPKMSSKYCLPFSWINTFWIQAWKSFNDLYGGTVCTSLQSNQRNWLLFWFEDVVHRSEETNRENTEIKRRMWQSPCK